MYRISRREEIPPLQRRAAVVAILALHGAVAWGLLQVDSVHSAVAEAAPLFVELIAPPATERSPEPPAPPPPPMTKATPPPAPVIAATPRVEAPATFVVPPPPPEPASPAAPAPTEPPVVVVAAPAPAAPPAPTAAPRELPASAIQYLEPPEPVYPRASRRAGEAGLVVVRVFVGTDGLPKQLQLQRSSGFERLDAAALDGVRRARFRPPTENGQPTAGWARIPIPFELEN